MELLTNNRRLGRTKRSGATGVLALRRSGCGDFCVLPLPGQRDYTAHTIWLLRRVRARERHLIAVLATRLKGYPRFGSLILGAFSGISRRAAEL